MITLQKVENALKTVYLNLISEKLNNSNPFLSQVEKTTTYIWGKEIRKDIPTKGGECLQIESTLKTLYAKIEITDKEVKASQIGASNIVNLLNMKIEEMLSESIGEVNEMLFKGKNSFTSFDSIFSDSEEIYGVNRSDSKKLKPLLKTDFGEVSLNKISEIIDELDGCTNMIICNHATKRAYQQYLLDHSQNIDIIDVGDGIKVISHLGIPIVADKYCPNGTMYLLNTNDFKYHQLCDWRWIESENGRVLQRKYSEPKYVATLVKYGDLICDNISRQAKITGIKDKSDKSE